ncbi:hypothetical protein BBJ28_00010364 [Nothophytophthora sp. Chile5]|nr:hypothetical protein BBJ28_00010364 [Nothophytophthora sp. Chile5]
MKLNETAWVDDMEVLIEKDRYWDGVSELQAFAFGFDTEDNGHAKLGPGSEEAPVTTVIYRHIYRIHYGRTLADVEARITEATAAWRDTRGCELVAARFSEQWLRGRFTGWFCAAPPPGYVKTNNSCEQFNRDFKRDYTKHVSVPLNALFQLLLSAARDRSVKLQPFRLEPEPAGDQVARYRKLDGKSCFSIDAVQRGTVVYMLSAAVLESQMFRVRQRGLDRAQSGSEAKEETSDDISYDSDAVEEEIEIDDQSESGWTVGIDRGICDCRVWVKHSYSLHLIACRVLLRLDVEGYKPPRVQLKTKGRDGKSKRGRRAKVGPALAHE